MRTNNSSLNPNKVLPKIGSAKSNSSQNLSNEVNALLKKYLLPKEDIVDYLNKKPEEDIVAIRTENFYNRIQKNDNEIKAPNNKRLENALSEQPNPFNKEFNSAFSDPKYISSEGFHLPYHVQNVLSNEDYTKLRELRKKLKEQDTPEAKIALEKLKLLTRVSGINDGYNSYKNRMFKVYIDKDNYTILNHGDYKLKKEFYRTAEVLDFEHSFRNYVSVVESMIKGGEITLNTDSRFLLKHYVAYSARNRMSLPTQTSVNLGSFSEMQILKMNDNEFDSYISYDDEGEVKKIVDGFTKEDIIKYNSQDPEFAKKVANALQKKQYRISSEFIEQESIDKRSEYVLKPGINHKDIVLFDEDIKGERKENILKIQKEMQKQQADYFSKAKKQGLLSGFTKEEIEKMKTDPVRILLYKDGKYQIHPLDSSKTINQATVLPKIKFNSTIQEIKQLREDKFKKEGGSEFLKKYEKRMYALEEIKKGGSFSDYFALNNMSEIKKQVDNFNPQQKSELVRALQSQLNEFKQEIENKNKLSLNGGKPVLPAIKSSDEVNVVDTPLNKLTKDELKKLIEGKITFYKNKSKDQFLGKYDGLMNIYNKIENGKNLAQNNTSPEAQKIINMLNANPDQKIEYAKMMKAGIFDIKAEYVLKEVGENLEKENKEDFNQKFPSRKDALKDNTFKVVGKNFGKDLEVILKEYRNQGNFEKVGKIIEALFNKLNNIKSEFENTNTDNQASTNKPALAVYNEKTIIPYFKEKWSKSNIETLKKEAADMVPFLKAFTHLNLVGYQVNTNDVSLESLIKKYPELKFINNIEDQFEKNSTLNDVLTEMYDTLSDLRFDLETESLVTKEIKSLKNESVTDPKDFTEKLYFRKECLKNNRLEGIDRYFNKELAYNLYQYKRANQSEKLNPIRARLLEALNEITNNKQPPINSNTNPNIDPFKSKGDINISNFRKEECLKPKIDAKASVKKELKDELTHIVKFFIPYDLCQDNKFLEKYETLKAICEEAKISGNPDILIEQFPRLSKLKENPDLINEIVTRLEKLLDTAKNIPRNVNII